MVATDKNKDKRISNTAATDKNKSKRKRRHSRNQAQYDIQENIVGSSDSDVVKTDKKKCKSEESSTSEVTSTTKSARKAANGTWYLPYQSKAKGEHLVKPVKACMPKGKTPWRMLSYNERKRPHRYLPKEESRFFSFDESPKWCLKVSRITDSEDENAPTSTT